MPTTIAQPVSETKGKAPAKKTVAQSPQQFVTKEEFNQLTEMMSKIVDVVTDLKKNPATPASAEAEEVRKAKADQAPINPAWEEKAIEIIGEAVDHCEVFYPKAGGQIFTVVIKPEFTNASKEYMDRMKSDRRSREVGSEGISGVESWCKLIRQNLKKSQAK